MNTWLNTDAVDKIPMKEEYVGFVYKILDHDNSKVYYGIKRLWETRKLKPLKGKKRKRLKVYETDWKTYKTSSPLMQEKLSKKKHNCSCKIIMLCTSVTEMKAYEAYYQLKHYIDGDWDSLYNEVINLRLRIRKDGSK